MNTLTIGRNIKRLREEQNITQQLLAEKLSISFQAVSKWETGVTLPDVTLLPAIAETFGVTIDDLFRPNMAAYHNKAERLMSLYESKTNNMEIFHQADREYKKMFESGKYTDEDLGYYAYLIECHARYYLKVAEEYYIKSIELGSQLKEKSFYKNQRQYILFLSRIGRSQESIEKYSKLILEEPDNPMHYSCLVAAYQNTGDLKNAIKVAETGLGLFPNNSILLAYAGDIYKQLMDYDNAKKCWERAWQLDQDLIDAQYSLACYYIENQLPEQAEKSLNKIIAWNNERGYEIENQWAESELKKLSNLKSKMNNLYLQ
jgi:transcriptional regulator with XRE-family HTH domain